MVGKAKNSRKGKRTAVPTLTRLKLSKALALQQKGQLQEAKIICEDILKERPDHFDSLHLLGLIALQGGDYYQAAKLISKAVDIYPHNPAFFYHLGVALQELGELDGAMTGYDLATAMKPDFTEAWYNWGNALQKRERFEEAVACYDKAISGKGDFPEAHYNRAMAFKELEKYEEALLAYDQAIALKPDYGEAYFGRGNTLAELKRPLDALTDYDHALSLRPDYTEVYLGRGIILQGLKRLDEALASYDQAIALNPDYAEAYLGRGSVLHELERFDEAFASYDQAINIKPDFIDAHLSKGAILEKSRFWELAFVCYNLAAAISPSEARIFLLRGNVLQKLHQYEDAIASYDHALVLKPDLTEVYSLRSIPLCELQRYDEAIHSCDEAIAINPDYVDAYLNRGHTLQRAGRLDDALTAYDQTLAVKPDYVPAYNNLGTVFFSLRQMDTAFRYYEQAIAIDPCNPLALWNKSLALLLTGQFTEGWKLYEWRWQREDFSSPKRNFLQPLWLGQDSLAGKTILLHSEQGLGDTIQFCRYIPLVARLGARVILEGEEALVPLLKDLEGIEEIIAKGKTLPNFDYHCPLMSLPLAFGTELHTIPSAPQYLQASPEKLTYWQDKLGKKTKPRIGLVWSGRKIHKNDRNRSISLAEWIPCLPAGYQYISLQKDIREADEETLQKHGDILRFDQELRDFSDTAALCALMDVVISVDTSVAHLSGALGKPTWILLSFVPDWRWLLDRKDSPWYPSVTLYRQHQRGDWSSVFAEVRNDLLAIGDRKVTD